MNLVREAMMFAYGAHAAAGQVRKYTGEPYIVHPQAVYRLVSEVTDDIEVHAAAWLHDVVEDTEIDLSDIYRLFTPRVTDLVNSLTDVSQSWDGNRAARKEIDRQHIAKASPAAKTIKLADLIDNTSSITQHDPEFAKIYMAEKRALLEVLGDGHPQLFAQAKALIDDYFADG